MKFNKEDKYVIQGDWGMFCVCVCVRVSKVFDRVEMSLLEWKLSTITVLLSSLRELGQAEKEE